MAIVATVPIDDSDGSQTVAQGDAVYRTAIGIRALRRGVDADRFYGMSLGQYPDPEQRGPVEVVTDGEVCRDADPSEVFEPNAVVFIVEGNPQAVTAKPNGLPIGRVAPNQYGVIPGRVVITLWVTLAGTLDDTREVR